MRGFSLFEIMLVIAAFAVLTAIAVPSLLTARARVDVAAAREAFATYHALGRQVAAQYGRLCRLHIDPRANRFWVTADTSSRTGVVVLDTVTPLVEVGEQFGGVRMEATARVLCFDPSGLATARGDCDLPNTTVVFRRGSIADTVTISRLGRVLRR
jgi:prepilin-type N-terminal cleavage/methylation domain-containing protein